MISFNIKYKEIKEQCPLCCARLVSRDKAYYVCPNMCTYVGLDRIGKLSYIQINHKDKTATIIYSDKIGIYGRHMNPTLVNWEFPTKPMKMEDLPDYIEKVKILL